MSPELSHSAVLLDTFKGNAEHISVEHMDHTESHASYCFERSLDLEQPTGFEDFDEVLVRSRDMRKWPFINCHSVFHFANLMWIPGIFFNCPPAQVCELLILGGREAARSPLDGKNDPE